MGVRELKRKKLRIRVKDKGERKETCERVAVERRTNGQKVETDQKGEEEGEEEERLQEERMKRT